MTPEALDKQNSDSTGLAVRAPVTTLMLAGMIPLLGGIALSRLAVDLMPDMSFPTLSIVTVYQGAGPEEVETLITRPIEQAVSSIPGVDRIFSESMEGSSAVRVRFAWGTNLDLALSDIRQQLDRIRRVLPDDIDPPYVQFDIADTPILLMGLHSELSAAELTILADRVILPRLEQVDGVARVRPAWRGDPGNTSTVGSWPHGIPRCRRERCAAGPPQKQCHPALGRF
ncbi:MAG: efflux RND transporter permease subunit [Planctomycetaceae bacterium]